MAVKVGARYLVAALLFAFVSLSNATAKNETPFPIAFGGPFELVDQDGRTRSDVEFRGRFLLITFGYIQCPSICPRSLQTIAAVLDDLGPLAKELNAVFVSVDPERDRPKLLAPFVAAIHPGLLGLSGTEAQIAKIAKAYKLHRRKIILSAAENGEDYLVDHGSLTYLMGPDGSFVTLFPFNVTPIRMARTIRKYLAHAGS